MRHSDRGALHQLSPYHLRQFYPSSEEAAVYIAAVTAASGSVPSAAEMQRYATCLATTRAHAAREEQDAKRRASAAAAAEASAAQGAELSPAAPRLPQCLPLQHGCLPPQQHPLHRAPRLLQCLPLQHSHLPLPHQQQQLPRAVIPAPCRLHARHPLAASAPQCPSQLTRWTLGFPHPSCPMPSAMGAQATPLMGSPCWQPRACLHPGQAST